MCFNRELETGFAKIAEKDIYAFKILKKRGKEFYAPARGSIWRLLELMEEPLFERIATNSVNRGFHCLKTLKDAQAYSALTFRSLKAKIYKVKIPKGSLYWENRTQYCSERIMLVNPNQYLKNGELSKTIK